MLKQLYPVDFILTDFRHFGIRPNSIDLVNASYALPFCPPDDFPRLWNSVLEVIRPGGCFAGQFFGDRDSWNQKNERMTFHTIEQLLEILTGLDIIHFHEDEKDGISGSGPKHWHVFHIVATKKDTPLPKPRKRMKMEF